jgi:hypothetical protein
MRVEGLFLPGRQHRIEAPEREDEEQNESGDPPETGNGLRKSSKATQFSAEIAEEAEKHNRHLSAISAVAMS